MAQTEYEQKKAECWENFCEVYSLKQVHILALDAFRFAFDRAYALGKQTDTISREEIEKAAQEYSQSLGKNRNVTWNDAEKGFMAGANFALGKHGQKLFDNALGKQEKDADTVIQGWVARDEYAVCPCLYNSKPLRQKKGFEDGYWSYGLQVGISLDSSIFPDLTWDDEPQEVEIIIKRKKNGNNSTDNRI